MSKEHNDQWYTFSTMPVADTFASILTATLGAFLAFSNGTAHLIEQHLLPEDARIAHQKSENIPSGIAAVIEALHANPRYQQAASTVAEKARLSPVAVEEAVVNVFCTATSGKEIRTTTGSGVFIDPRGIILTNAHVAQFLLLEDPTSSSAPRCVIRQGSPAISKYQAELLYISPSWIDANAYQLYTEKPIGTGEHDFALLYVTAALDDDVPVVFPALIPLTLSAYEFYPHEVAAAGYPANADTIRAPQSPLVPIVADTAITHLFTFGSGMVDLISIAPSAVGQQGSSGGPIVDEDGNIVGLIVTRGNVDKEGEQSLRALTLPYINRTLTEETGLDLAHTLAGDLEVRAEIFRETLMPYLRATLTAQSERE